MNVKKVDMHRRRNGQGETAVEYQDADEHEISKRMTINDEKHKAWWTDNNSPTKE
jgi:hypothetical protein